MEHYSSTNLFTISDLNFYNNDTNGHAPLTSRVGVQQVRTGSVHTVQLAIQIFTTHTTIILPHAPQRPTN